MFFYILLKVNRTLAQWLSVVSSHALFVLKATAERNAYALKRALKPYLGS